MRGSERALVFQSIKTGLLNWAWKGEVMEEERRGERARIEKERGREGIRKHRKGR